MFFLSLALIQSKDREQRKYRNSKNILQPILTNKPLVELENIKLFFFKGHLIVNY